MSRISATVCVVGSFMTDLVMRLPHALRPGETLLADRFGVFLGGKGFNQAIAARRMGAEVAIIGRIGADEYGARFRAKLAEEGIDDRGVVTDPDDGTGIAVPLIEPGGGNSIAVAPRANLRLTADDIERAGRLITTADIVLAQLETSLESVEATARLARGAGRTFVLNPAPARAVPDGLLAMANVLTPNEGEAATLSGRIVDGMEAAWEAAESLRQRGPGIVIITLAEHGAIAAAAGRPNLMLPGHSVPVVDTTAAGDAFNGALAARLAAGDDLETALRWANAAGACAVTRLGAEPSLPHAAEVAALLRAQ
ncbi:MAG: ribokinase [Dehalococcoidia bacterium]